MLLKHLRQWLVPGGTVFLLSLLVVTLASEGLLLTLSSQYRWVAYGLAAALAGGFHRSRVFTVVLGLGALDLVTGDAPELDAMGALGSVFLLTVGVLSLSRDRGVASTTGASQIVGATVLALIPGLIFYDSVNVGAFTGVQVLPAWTTDWTGFPQPVILVALISFGFTAYSAYRWQGVIERGLLWAQAIVLVAMHPGIGFPGDAVLMMAAAVTLGLAVLEGTYAMAYRDELTGLPARRALVRDLEELAGTYTVAMVDIDHFKRFNDKHGHDVGDQVLKMVASRLARARGKAYRFGGEEFTLIFPGARVEECVDALDALRQEIDEADFALRSWIRPRERPEGPLRAKAAPKTLDITVSVGVADSIEGEGDADAVVKAADQALYRAKESGRNRVSR